MSEDSQDGTDERSSGADRSGPETASREAIAPGGGGGGDGGDQEENTQPTARIDSACQDLSCQFFGSDSEAPDGEIVEYEWDFGDGTTARGESAIHAFESGGGHTVTLTVTDDDGATDTTTETVSLQEPPEPPEEVLSVAALVPTVVHRENGEWRPRKKYDTSREEVWEIPTMGDHWFDQGGDPPDWLDGFSTRTGSHYLKIPGVFLISTSLDPEDHEQHIPWNPDVEFGSSHVLYTRVPNVNEPGAYEFEVVVELPQTSQSYLNRLGSMTLTMTVGSDSRFHDELNASSVLGDHEVRVSTDNRYGAEYSHQEALGDALETAYERLKKMHTILSVSTKGVVKALEAAGATLTFELVAKKTGKEAAKQALKMAAKEVVTEAKERLEEPTSEQLSPDQLDEASAISGTAFYTTSADGETLGMSGPMLVVRSE